MAARAIVLVPGVDAAIVMDTVGASAAFVVVAAAIVVFLVVITLVVAVSFVAFISGFCYFHCGCSNYYCCC